MRPRPRRHRELEQALGHRFARPALLEEALTHASAASGGVAYERLEFLGDRVLALVMADLLLRRFPEEPEGDLALRHAALVRREAVLSVAEAVDLGRHLILSKGESEAGGRLNPTILGDACEAVIAALYLDGGFAAAQRFVEDRWTPLVAMDVEPPQDAKTALQEWAQGRGKPLPTYETLSVAGPPHEPTFVIEVRVEGLEPATASGSSKRAAEQVAAAALLERVAATDDA
ncbi:MAG: ribonuclease III [Proteobacteria bacterium]|nr:ribonuclease III [Pseudomonadota bacterium]